MSHSSTSFTLTLDDVEVQAFPGETLWQVAKRAGETIPHLCFKDAPGYRADGNCRACMVEVEGERVLAASCIREAAPNMVVRSTGSSRVKAARKGVLELLLADQPERENSPDRSSHLWDTADQLAIDVGAVRQRIPAHSERNEPTVHHVEPRSDSLAHASGHDASHSAMNVNLDACITCGLCERACREVQGNDVIGLAHRGAASKVVFDFDDPMGDSTCVACGECVQACPTGALMPATLIDARGRGDSATADRKVDSVCPYCGVGCQLTYHVKDGPTPAGSEKGEHRGRILFVEGKDGPSNQGRLCVKGRFGFDYPSHPARLTRPLIRREGVPKGLDPNFDPANPLTHFREASWEEALDLAANGLTQLKTQHGPAALAGFGSAKCSNEEAWLFQKLVDGVPGLRRRHCFVHAGASVRCGHPHRLQPGREPSGGCHLFQTGRQKRHQAHNH